jgi:outer membrane scaffolding protein for murein synthesis (MipA/OmpV family)
MPDLDATVQIGPALNLKLWDARGPDRSLILFLPLRAAFAADIDRVESVGYTLAPQLTYYRRVPLAGCDWKLALTGGLQFGSGAFHDYYYTVAPEHASASRPAYDAGGGFAGYRFIGTFLCRYPQNWISFFARYDRVDGAVFEDSPLVRRNAGLTAGFVFTWIVGRSARMVDVTDWKYE